MIYSRDSVMFNLGGNLMLTTARRASFALATAAALTATALLAPAAADAATLSCRASISDSTPSQYSDVYVHVRSRAHVHVHTVAHYKTTDTAQNARTNGRGRATVDYYISGATSGFKVRVDVTVRGPHHTAHCATSFTPH